jgi:hypothetical protein
VPYAWASTIFSDVPPDNPFSGSIDAIANAGITTGCAPGQYCPGDNVSRQAMAAFMHRGFGRVAALAGGASDIASSAVVGTVALTPGLPNGALPSAAGFIKVDASVNVVGDSVSGCPCIWYIGAFDRESMTLIQDFIVGATVGPAVPEMTVPINVAYRVTGTAVRNIDIFAELVSGTGSADFFTSTTATYVPFGSTGTNSLEPAAQASPQPAAGRDGGSFAEQYADTR